MKEIETPEKGSSQPQNNHQKLIDVRCKTLDKMKHNILQSYIMLPFPNFKFEPVSFNLITPTTHSDAGFLKASYHLRIYHISRIIPPLLRFRLFKAASFSILSLLRVQ